MEVATDGQDVCPGPARGVDRGGIIAGTGPVIVDAGAFHLSIHDEGSPQRPAMEQFISTAFHQKHGATVRSFMPTLIGVHAPDGALGGAAGYRAADRQSLYLEQYLDSPIEQVLALRTGHAVQRFEIAEIGNLAGASCRMARRLVMYLPLFLRDRGHAWVVFTATGMIRDILEHVGSSLIDLGPAEPARVAASPDDWGTYYQARPHVMAGSLATASLVPRRLRRH